MDRRNFLKTAAAVGVLSSASGVSADQVDQQSGGKFKLKYAPSFNQFKNLAGNDLIDQIKFMSDNGFSAMFDNGIMGKSPELQKKIAAELDKRDMELGPFVLYADFSVESMVKNDKDSRQMLLERMKKGVETAKRVHAKWALVVPGRYNQRMDWDYQTANVIECLKMCSEECEKSGLVLVIEPLNKMNHPGLFLTKMSQAYQICKAVNSPCCKIVDDLYHQQITEGNLIPNIDASWSEIAAFHLGDNPGRKEPGTGEINFKNIFKHIHSKGYKGVLCMEHGKSGKGKEGDLALLKAYREADTF